jgi:uncharacterized repeat protein (TIGR04138 family)
MTLFHAGLIEIVQRDPRYAYEAYEFLFHALHHTQKLLGREPPEVAEGEPAPPVDRRHHVSGRELVEGARDLALREFGFMARTVFRQWGIQRTDDFGEMVFNLVEAGLMSKTDDDRKEDFCGVFDLDRALVQEFRFSLDEANEP